MARFGESSNSNQDLNTIASMNEPRARYKGQIGNRRQQIQEARQIVAENRAREAQNLSVQEANARAEYILKLVRRAEQGKPFWGWGLDSNTKQLVNDIRAGRITIEQAIPNANPSFVAQVQQQQNSIRQGSIQAGKNYNSVGMDAYDKPVKITTKDSSGRIAEEQIIKGIPQYKITNNKNGTQDKTFLGYATETTTTSFNYEEITVDKIPESSSPVYNFDNRKSELSLIDKEMIRAKATKFSWFNLGGYIESQLFINIPAYRNWVSKGLTTEEGFAKYPITSNTLSYIKGVTDTIPVASFLSPATLTGQQQVKFNEGIRQLEQQELYSKASKYPYIGTRTVNGNTATDLFSKSVKTSDASLQSGGKVVNKLITENTYSYTGGIKNTVKTSDLISTFTPPQTYTETSYYALGGKGVLMPTRYGVTPSFGKSNTFNLLDINSAGGQVKANIFPEGLNINKQNFGGRTGQIQNYVVSQSGKFKQFNYNFDYKLLDTGLTQMDKSYSMTFRKDTSAILKIVESPSESTGGIVTIQKGNFISTTPQTPILSQTTLKLPIQAPKPVISETLSGISALTNPVTTSILSSTKTLTQTKQTQANIQKSNNNVKTIPQTETITKVTTRTVTKTIPSTTTIQRTVTITTPIETQITKIPSINRGIPNIPIITPQPAPKIPTELNWGKNNQLKNPLGNFRVEVRRGGVFKTVAKAPTLAKAFSIGKNKVSNTLGVTFRLRGQGQFTPFKMPKSIKKAKGTLTFMELPKYRINTFGEKNELKLARMKL